MKKILQLILISVFSFACSQNKIDDYKDDVDELQKFVEDIYKNDSLKVESYVKRENGKIFRIKTNDA